MTTTFTITIDTQTGGDSSFFFPGDRPYVRQRVEVKLDGRAADIDYRAAPNGVVEADTLWRVSYAGVDLTFDDQLYDVDGLVQSARLLRNDVLYASLAIDLDPDYTLAGAPVSSTFDLTPDSLLNHMTVPALLKLVGNIGDDRLTGSGRGDVLDGRIGSDTMIGRGGNDSYFVDDVLDRVVEIAGEGTDTVNSTISYTLGAALENLTLLGGGNINGVGNAGNNTLVGNAGRNILVGGAGDDAYWIQTVGDRVVEEANGGGDAVFSTVSYAASANIEVIVLEGAADIDATGNAGANALFGNTGRNVLAGGAGDDLYSNLSVGDRVVEAANAGVDTIETEITFTAPANVENITLMGVAAINAGGNDLANILTGNVAVNTLAGGKGDDTYYIQTVGDRVSEKAGEGYDTVRSAVTYTASANIERVVLTGAADIDVTGNAAANSLAGNAGKNTLNGGGGADRMAGGLGDDTYETDGGDTITEAANAGIDTVRSTATHTLAANVERLVLLGTATIDGIGNALDNSLEGNAGANRLNGREGADFMVGRGGDDTYYFDNVGDIAVENPDAGVDTIISTISVTLGSFIENVALAGTAAINATGNASANVLTGSDAANRLYGGLGDDTLRGNGGADIFAFTTAPGAGNVDRIVDFSVADDTIWLSAVVFPNLAAGTLAANAFVTGTAALDANDRIIHDRAGGRLLFDADGSGDAVAVVFATVTAGLAITNADFAVINVA